MSFADFLGRMLEGMQEEPEPEPMRVVPILTTEKARDICMRERESERLAAEHVAIERVEIVVDEAGCFGTLRFHPDDGHIHGMLWVERISGRWVAYPFAGTVNPGDPEALIARLDRLGTPYQRPGFEDANVLVNDPEDDGPPLFTSEYS